MENKKTVSVGITEVMLILCAVAIILNIVGIFKARVTLFENIGFFVIPSISAFLAMLYCFMEYSKKPQKFYRISIGCFAVSQAIIALVSFILLGIPFLTHSFVILNVVCAIIEAICLFILAFGKDLGVTASKVLAGIVLVLAFVVALVSTLSTGITATAGIRFTNLVLAIVVWIMVYGKYLDKAARGTK